MKGILSKLFLVVMVFSLISFSFGCKDASADVDKVEEMAEEETAEEIEEEESATSEEAATDELIKLTHWEMMNTGEDVWVPAVEKIAKGFNDENPNIEVTVEFIQWDGFYETFLTAVTGGAAPDTSTGAFPQAFQYAEMNEILDLSSILTAWEKEGVDLQEEFLPGSLELHQYNNMQVGMPLVLGPVHWGYRTDIFEEAGITETPRTWEDFLEACRTIKEKTDVIPVAFSGVNPWGFHFVLDMLFSNGVGFVDENINAAFTDPRVIETLEFIETLYTEELISPATGGYTHGDAVNLYTSGDAAIIFSPYQEIFTDFPGISENTSIMPAFAGPNGTPTNLTWVDIIMAYSQTEYPEETKMWLKYYMDNNLNLWTDANYWGIPARKSFASDSFFSNKRYNQELEEKILSETTMPIFPAKSIFSGFALIEGEGYPGIALQEILTGNTDIEGIANETNNLIEQALESSK